MIIPRNAVLEILANYDISVMLSWYKKDRGF
jgi:hypothetical protein